MRKTKYNFWVTCAGSGLFVGRAMFRSLTNGKAGLCRGGVHAELFGRWADRFWWRRCLVSVFAVLLAFASSSMAESYEEEVMRLSERGEDVEAVALYERELADQDVPVAVLRAVAASYWRLRQFDTARLLYRRVMQHQPTLSGLVGEEDAAVPGVVEKPEEIVSEEKGMAVPEDVPIETEPDTLSSATKGFQQELDALRSAYTQLEEDRERRREAVEARIVELMVRTEDTLEQMESLERELAETREERDHAVDARDQAAEEHTAKVARLEETLQNALARKQEVVENKQALEASLEDERTAKSRAEDAATTRIAALEEEVATIRENLEKQEAIAREREAELEGRIRALAERESVLEQRRAEEQEQFATARRESAQQIATLEEELSDVKHQLDSERIAARARRTEYLDAEKRLQDALAEQQARYKVLSSAHEALQAAAAEDAQAREQLVDQFASERLAHEAYVRETAQEKERLARELAAEEERVNALAAELEKLQQHMERVRVQSEERFSELEAERDEKADLLREGRRAMEDLRRIIEEREKQWASERMELEQALEEQQELLLAERKRFVVAMETLEVREEQLQTKLAEQEKRAALSAAEADDRISALEAEIDELAAMLTEARESIEGTALDRALQEISIIEAEFSELERKREREQRDMRERIEALEERVAAERETRDTLEESLESEQERNEGLEEEVRALEAALAESRSLLDDASATLNQHYDALRRQLEADGVSVPVTDTEKEDSGLVPLIGKIGAFTESAASEVHALRNAFRAEQEALTEALAQMQRERDTMAEAFEALSEEALRKQAELQEKHEQQISALEASWEEQQQALQADIDRKKQALAGMRTFTERMQADAEASRRQQARALQAARDSAAELNRRMEELEREASMPSGSVRVNGSVSQEDSLLAPVQQALQEGDLQQVVLLYGQLGEDVDIPLETLRAIANAYRSLRLYEEAYDIYEKIQQRYPDNSFAEQKIVMTLFDMGSYERALERLSASERTPMRTEEEK